MSDTIRWIHNPSLIGIENLMDHIDNNVNTPHLLQNGDNWDIKIINDGAQYLFHYGDDYKCVDQPYTFEQRYELMWDIAVTIEEGYL